MTHKIKSVFGTIVHYIINKTGYQLITIRNPILNDIQIKQNSVRLVINKSINFIIKLLNLKILFIKKTSSVSWITVNKDISKINNKIDHNKIADLRKTTLATHINKNKNPNDILGSWKFMDTDLWIPVNLERAYSLGLHKSPPINILDISCGAGYFAFICKHFGHNVHTTDIDQWTEFNEMIKILNVERSVLWVKPETELPRFNKSFDLITSFMVAYNFPNKYNKNVWDKKQWHFFLKDLKNNHLNKNGKIYILLNPLKKNTYYSQDIYNFFLNIGAEINGPEIYFENTEKI